MVSQVQITRGPVLRTLGFRSRIEASFLRSNYLPAALTKGNFISGALHISSPVFSPFIPLPPLNLALWDI